MEVCVLGLVKSEVLRPTAGLPLTAPTVPSTENDNVDDHYEMDPQGSSHSTGGFSQSRAVGNNFNWGDAVDIMDPLHWNPLTYGKVLLFVNCDPGTAPYMSFSTETSCLEGIVRDIFSNQEEEFSDICV